MKRETHRLGVVGQGKVVGDDGTGDRGASIGLDGDESETGRERESGS